MPRGGPRTGTGPKPGTKRITAKAQADFRAKARGAGKLLPHEILLRAANGESFKFKKLHITYYGRGPNKGQEKHREWVEEEHWPSYSEQIDAAKAAAPYYAPRLASQTIGTDEKTAEALAEVMQQLSKQLPN